MSPRHDNPPPAPNSSDWASRRHLQTLAVLAAAVAGLYLCCRLAAPFLGALAWALALAVLFTPMHRWMEARTRRPGLAATLSVLVVGLIVVVPSTFLGQRLIQEASKGAELIQAKAESGEWRQALQTRPRVKAAAAWVERQVDLPGSVKTLAAWLSGAAGSFLKGSLVQATGFCVTFYVLFYFFRDRRAGLEAMRKLSPLSEGQMNRLFARVSDTIYATVYGTLAVAAVQGLLGGLMFWWLGLPTPLLWGVVMGLLAVVPVLGAFVIWVPAALFLAVEGSWGKALTLALWGTIVVGGIDNLLHPILVGNRLRLHTVLAFMSVVGGLILFGPAGLILGPVVLTLTVELLAVWPARPPHEPPERRRGPGAAQPRSWRV